MTKRGIAITGIGLTGAGVLVALAQLATSSVGGESQQVDFAPSGDVNINPSVGTNGCIVIQGTCIITPGSPGPDPRESLAALPSASQPPSGSGPWVFVVYGTGDLGLYVRDGYTIDDSRLPGDPTVAEGTAVYVDCHVEDGWVADPSVSDVGRWYKIRFPETSTQSDTWVYAGYTLPVNHNGQVPLCDGV